MWGKYSQTWLPRIACKTTKMVLKSQSQRHEAPKSGLTVWWGKKTVRLSSMALLTLGQSGLSVTVVSASSKASVYFPSLAYAADLREAQRAGMSHRCTSPGTDYDSVHKPTYSLLDVPSRRPSLTCCWRVRGSLSPAGWRWCSAARPHPACRPPCMRCPAPSAAAPEAATHTHNTTPISTGKV